MLTSQDTLDFRRARTKSLLRRLWAMLARRNIALLSWDEVRARLHLCGFVHRGVQAVPLKQIVGSVGRYRDFDDAFLPLRDHSLERWRRINCAFRSERCLPPVQLYKVGEVYFVLDGNHRVSVAREHGAAFIDAEVFEAIAHVPVTRNDLDAERLSQLGAYNAFLERTRLDVLRPGQAIRLTHADGYARLLEHIAVHRYFMGIEQKRAVSEEEAVVDWFDNVYQPIVEAIRKEGILAAFPERTEADLYLWLVDHWHYLKEAYGDKVKPEEAAQSFAAQFGKRAMRSSTWQTIRSVLEAVKAQGQRWFMRQAREQGAAQVVATSPSEGPAGWVMAASK